MATEAERNAFNRWFNQHQQSIKAVLFPKWLAAQTKTQEKEVIRQIDMAEIKASAPKPKRKKRAKTPDYYKYINSKEWKTKSAAWRQETPNCERCGTSENLQCHHLHYKTLGREQRCDILVVCYTCHCALHKCEKLGKKKRARKP